MREILFRAKDCENEWRYGFYSPLIWYPSREQTPSIKESGGGDIQIKLETLGQYTGLKDKNGKKIFEGDIVLVSQIAPAKVFYNEENACYAFDYGKNGRPLAIDLTTDKSLEIIGNIFDNPNLI